MTQKHTKLPKLVAAKNSDGTFDIGYMDEQNRDYSGCHSVTVAENVDAEHAAFIVRACNSHYELLEALKALLENEGCYATNSIGMRFDSDELELAKHKAREAIERAKER
jgi:hypothetical protein